MFCKHNYRYTQGHFYCTKCGHRTHNEHLSGKGSNKKFIVIGIVAVIIIGITVLGSQNIVHIPAVQEFQPDTRIAKPETTPKVAPVIDQSQPSVIKKTIEFKPTVLEKKTIEMYIIPTETKTKLVKLALDEVNKDRSDNGLEPVTLSYNEAAQVHAEDILKTRKISHWMTNGEKPYMTYTRYSGTGNVGQNISFSGFEDPQECKLTNVICDPVNPVKAITEAEYQMMNNDEVSNWGHRDNILDPNHTHVSFGIAYDKYTFVLVQNFEDNYIEFITPIGQNPDDIRIIGNTLKGEIQNISIYYDQYPTPQVYNMHKNDRSYGMGRLIALVEPPLPPNTYYQNTGSYSLIVAESMSQRGNTFNAIFDMSSIASKRGVYTITIWLKNADMSIPATSYAIFVE